MLRQGEKGPFWGTGHLSTLGTESSRRLHSIRAALEEF